MGQVRDALFDVLQICLRVLPWPTEPRLIRVGNPGRDAPVLMTCNYAFTVRRVLHSLRGQSAYVLVAPTRGINVWCAAVGGMFTAHQVVSILRSSGIGDKVDHRRLILPQLSAAGVERKLVEERTGWHVVFGPVYARDLPAHLATERKTDQMRQVRFSVGWRWQWLGPSRFQ
jgi:CO dehydrogenase/acetyl-CoA synthase gamma subunit (corrinoid Fe-S protein)